MHHCASWSTNTAQVLGFSAAQRRGGTRYNGAGRLVWDGVSGTICKSGVSPVCAETPDRMRRHCSRAFQPLLRPEEQTALHSKGPDSRSLAVPLRPAVPHYKPQILQRTMLLFSGATQTRSAVVLSASLISLPPGFCCLHPDLPPPPNPHFHPFKKHSHTQLEQNHSPSGRADGHTEL